MANDPDKKRRYGLRELFLALFGIGIVLTIILKYSGGSLIKERHSEEGEASEIEFEMPDGKGTSIRKLRGRVVLLNFWASWCGPCLEEMPSLKMLEEHF